MPSKTQKDNNKNHIQGFSLVELLVVMFILSLLAYISIPLFKAPVRELQGKGTPERNLARFIESVRHQAASGHQAYLLHLDLVAGRVWASPEQATTGGPDKDQQSDDREKADNGLDGLALSAVLFPDERDRDPGDTVIRVSPRGISDMALIQMEANEGPVTLKLHPFIYQVELIQGNDTFNDCI